MTGTGAECARPGPGGVADMGHVKIGLAAAAAALMAIGGGMLMADATDAADHNEPGSVVNNGVALNKALDIADIYAWNTADKVMMVYSFAGPGRDITSIGTYDRDGFYTLNISNDADPLTPEFVIEIRFGRNPDGKWGVQMKNVPGAAGTIEGPIQKTLTSGPVKAIAGVFDDPFFFDSQGLAETRVAGDLRFCNGSNPARQVPPQGGVGKCDFFFGTNDTMIVLEMPRAALDKGNPLNIWVRSARLKPGVA
ncbi:MAG: hypothetical protein JWM75_2080 [Sphingomonas bacterium]|nr:hypothetical protein [Sphingomonas bacterium]